MRKKTVSQRADSPAITRAPVIELTSVRARSGTPIRSVTKVVIVDDDANLREELAQILTDMDGFECVGAYTNSFAALQEIPRKQPEIVLMDIRMRGMSGIECTRRLKLMAPTIKIIVLTGAPELDLMMKALKAGASGYLTKPFNISNLRHAIDLVLSGGVPVSEKAIQQFVHPRSDAAQSTETSLLLTSRESEIIPFLARGLQYKEIADHLHISLCTVKQHLHNIYGKLRVKNRVEALNQVYLRDDLEQKF